MRALRQSPPRRRRDGTAAAAAKTKRALPMKGKQIITDLYYVTWNEFGWSRYATAIDFRTKSGVGLVERDAISGLDQLCVMTGDILLG